MALSTNAVLLNNRGIFVGNKKVIGGIVAGVVVAAVGGLLVWKRRNKSAATITPVPAVPTVEAVTLDAETIHRQELTRYMGSLNLEKANQFMNYYAELEKLLMENDPVEDKGQAKDLGNHITFLMSLKNRMAENPQNAVLLLQAAEDFPPEVYAAVDYMPEELRLKCRRLAEGISACLSDGVFLEELRAQAQ